MAARKTLQVDVSKHSSPPASTAESDIQGSQAQPWRQKDLLGFPCLHGHMGPTFDGSVQGPSAGPIPPRSEEGDSSLSAATSQRPKVLSFDHPNVVLFHGKMSPYLLGHQCRPFRPTPPRGHGPKPILKSIRCEVEIPKVPLPNIISLQDLAPSPHMAN
jgi:hypothetical protein